MFRVLGFWVWRFRGFRGFRAWGCGFRVLEFGFEARGLCACVFSYPKTLKPRLENRCRRRRRCCGCLNISGVCWLLPGLGGQQPTCVVSPIYIYIYATPPPSVIYLFRGFPGHAGEHVPKTRGHVQLLIRARVYRLWHCAVRIVFI